MALVTLGLYFSWPADAESVCRRVSIADTRGVRQRSLMCDGGGGAAPDRTTSGGRQ